MTVPLFEETQPIAPALMRFLASALVLLGCVLAMLQGSFAPLGALLFPFLVILLLAKTLRLVTEVRGDALYVRLYPFPFRRIVLAEIANATVRRYRPILEYGGWGIRWGVRGMAYNAYGDRGVQLVLTDGRRVLIGSQRSEELAAVIQQQKR